MKNNCMNIFKIARTAAGLTQERAAELIPTSVRSLADYERGVCVPDESIVSRMVTVYNAQFLAVQYLQLRKGSVLPECIRNIREHPLAPAVIKACNRLVAFARKHRADELLEIAEDGVIDQSERARYMDICEELEDMVTALMELLYSKEAEHDDPDN